MFLNKGSILTRHNNKIKKMGINTLYVEDQNDEITLQELLPTTVRLFVLKSLVKFLMKLKVPNSFN
jgi:hypothetical protein